MKKSDRLFYCLSTFLAVVTVLVFIAGPVAKYAALRSTWFDLGAFQWALFSFSHLGEWQRAFYGHIQPFMIMWAGAYGSFNLFHAAYFLVFLQAIVLIFPALVFWRIFGPFSAGVYLVYMPVWNNALFDFHFDHLAVPLLLGFYLAVKYQRVWWGVAMALLLMGVKEPFALQTIACGIYLAWIAVRNGWERKWLVAGAILVCSGFLYFYFVMHYALPYFSLGEVGSLDGEAFGWLGHSLFEMVSTIITRPHLVLWEIVVTPKKLTYLAVVFGSLAFVPLLRPVYLIPALPLLLIAMLSRLDNYYSYDNHYTVGLIIPVMFAFIHGLPKAHALWMGGGRWVWRKVCFPHPLSHPDTYLHTNECPLPNPLPQAGEGIYGHGLTHGKGGNVLGAVREARLSKTFYALLALWILGGHVMLSPSPISRLFWSDKVWSYSWRVYVPTERDAMMKAAMEKYIPADPDVSVTTQNSVNWGHLAHRKVYLPFPASIAEPHKVLDWSNRTLEGLWKFVRTGQQPPAITHDRYADYVVLDLKRPYFLLDRGCEWVYGECRYEVTERKFLDWVAYTRAHYDAVFERDGFMILRRR